MLLTLLALVGGGAGAWAAPPDPPAERAQRPGASTRADGESPDAVGVLVARGQYERALEAIRRLLGASDTTAAGRSTLHRHRATLFRQSGRLDAAEASLRASVRSLVHTPNVVPLVEALVASAQLARERGALGDSLAHLEEATRWSQTLPDAHPLRRTSAMGLALGELALATGSLDEADTHFADARAACAGDGVCVARADLGRGRVALSRGDAPSARRQLTLAAATFEAAERPQARAEALLDLARAHLLASEPDRARTRVDAAMALAQRLDFRPLLAEAHRVTGRVAQADGRTADAVAALNDARHTYAAIGSPLGEAGAALLLGQWLAVERPAEAVAPLEEALARFVALGELGEAQRARQALVQAARRAERPADEARWLARWLAAEPAPQEAWRGYARLGELASWHSEAPSKALLERAVASLERADVRTLTPTERRQVDAARQAPYDGLVEALLCEAETATPPRRAGRATGASGRGGGSVPVPMVTGPAVREALAVAERRRAHALVQLLIDRPADPMTRELDARVRRIEALDREAKALAAGPQDWRTTMTLEHLELRRAALESEVLIRDPRAGRRVPELVARRVAWGLDEVSERVEPDVALVRYHVAEPRSWAFVQTSDGLSAIPLPGRRTLSPDVLQLREALSRPAPTRRARRARLAVARRLYDGLVAPIAPAIGARSRLVVVPDTELADLPFDALVAPSRRDGEPGTAWLVRERVVSYAPSLAALPELTAEAARREGRTGRHDLVAFADPSYASHRRAPEPLTRLPATAREARRAGRHLGADEAPGTLYLGADATESNLKALALDRYRIVHLALHGLPAEGSDGVPRTALWFGDGDGDDGVLEATEVLDLRLDADLVVLSACGSGAVEEPSADGLAALTRAFLYAGSSNVMATLWAVEDRHAAGLMDRFYASVAEGADTATALRDARLALLNGEALATARAARRGEAARFRGIGGVIGTASKPPRRRRARRAPSEVDPFHWASFVLVGAPSGALRPAGR